MSENRNKNIILFIGKVLPSTLEPLYAFSKKEKRKFRIAVLHDGKQKLGKKMSQAVDTVDISLSCDMHNPTSIQKTLLPYRDELLAVTSRGDDQIPFLANVVPHLPYLKTPTSESLRWSIEKLAMRKRLKTHNKKIGPAYTLVHDTKKQTVKMIEEKIGFPLVIKPTGLGASRLVSICFHKEELEQSLKKVFRRIAKTYKEAGYTQEPNVLVEQFMEGEMYSTDAYVTARGKIYFCPMVHVKTGRAIGFDDFFGYQQMTPTLLKSSSIQAAQQTAREAVHALGLKNTTVHIELLNTEDGWKVIELGPRIGGFRHDLYKYAYGLDHTVNDILIRIPEKPRIPTRKKGYSTAMKFFAKEEGRLTKLTGIKKAQELSSFKQIQVNKKIGDQCRFAKHGGSSVFNIILFNKERSKLLADIRRLEQMVQIETE